MRLASAMNRFRVASKRNMRRSRRFQVGFNPVARLFAGGEAPAPECCPSRRRVPVLAWVAGETSGGGRLGSAKAEILGAEHDAVSASQSIDPVLYNDVGRPLSTIWELT